MKSFSKVWRNFVSRGIWKNERTFFYPKLRRFYLKQAILSPIIFDIGANRGQSIEFFQSIYSDSVIHAFEPSNAFIELKNTHSKSNVYLHNFGLSDCNKDTIFFECIIDEISSLEKPNIHSDYFRFKSKVLLTKPEDMLRETTIKVQRLDDVVSGLGVEKIDICKIDVEGHELRVLLGAQHTLKRHLIKFVQLEVHYDGQYTVSFSEIDSFLSSCRYELALTIKHGFGNFHDVIYVPKEKPSVDMS